MNSNKILNIAIWFLQTFIAFFFISIGIFKLILPETLPFPWIKDNPSLVPIAGLADLLGGIGLFFPSAFRKKPELSIYALYGLILLVISGSILHITRGEADGVIFNAIVISILSFILWGRTKRVPILPAN